LFDLLNNQLFETKDIFAVMALIVLEGLLSADNALVLAILVKPLPKDQQKKALLYGMAGAFGFRAVAILFATVILKMWQLQAVGAAYLIFVAVKHFLGEAKANEVYAKQVVAKSFWGTVIAVELTDIAFALDSVLAGVGFIGGNSRKLWVVIVGAVLGIMLLRVAAGFFVRLMDKYPKLDDTAYLLVGWVGIKLAFATLETYAKSTGNTALHISFPTWMFWTGLVLISLVSGFIATRKSSDSTEAHAPVELLEDVQNLSFEEEK
jgi:YkoY family integral membrane protein